MPITIIAPNTGVLTPGVQITASSDLIGPIPIDWEWWFSLVDPVTEAVQLQQRWIGRGQHTFSALWLDPTQQIIQANDPIFADGQPMRLLVQLTNANGIQQDSASTAIKYDTSTGIPVVQQLATDVPVTLDQEQSQQLQSTTEASALSALTDALLLTELTGGPSPGPLVFPLTTATFGVIVRLATIPSALVPQTPDGQYWVKTLAVVRVFRGNDLWIRAPIHTPTKIVAFEKEGLTIWVANVTLATWLLNIRCLVDFLPGVTGQVYQMHFP